MIDRARLNHFFALDRQRGPRFHAQAAFTGLYVWWAFVLGQPGDILEHFPVYAGFRFVGDEHYWLWRSYAMVGVGVVSMFPLPIAVRLVAITFQAAWLFLLAVCFILTARYPWLNTGIGAYAALAYIAVTGVAYQANKRQGDGDRR